LRKLNPNLNRDPFKLKFGTPVIPARGNFYDNFDFSTPFCFRVRSPYGTDRRTDGQEMYFGLSEEEEEDFA